MSGHVLDNPIWEALRSRHRDIALARGDVARYPAPIAPFLGVPREGVDVGDALVELIEPGETTLLLDRVPHAPPGFETKKR